MSSIRVNNIQNANGTSAIAIDSSGVATFSKTLVPSSSMMYRNLIINGDMRIDQRNAGASVTPTDGLYTLDRWRSFASQASKYTVQQNAGSVTPPVGFSNYLGITSSSAYSVTSSDYFLQQYRIEGFDFAHLGYGTANAKTTTLSFWVYSSLTGTFGGSLQNESNNRTYPFEYTISSSNTWEQKTITIAGDTTGTWTGSTNAIGIKLMFSLGSGSTYSGTAGSWVGAGYFSTTGATSVVGTSGATWYITGVQLEVGDAATPFEHRPYDAELARCQRYYWKYVEGLSKYINIGCLSSSSTMQTTVTFPTTMRTTPTFDHSTGTNYYGYYGVSNWDDFDSFTPEYRNLSSSGLYNSTQVSGTAGHGVAVATRNASAYIAFDAEL